MSLCRGRKSVRLNSGVRPLRAMLPQLRPAARRRNSPTGSSVGFLALCSNLVQRLVLASTSPGARGLSRQQTHKHSRPPQRFLAALSLCARATRLSDGSGTCVQPLALRSRARLSRSSATLRPNKSFKPTPLRSGMTVAKKACHCHACAPRRGLTQVLGCSGWNPSHSKIRPSASFLR